MLHYAVVFFVIALVAALFGFGGVAAGAVGIAKVLFFVFLVLAVVTFLFGAMKGKRVAKSSCWNRHFSRASCPLQLRWTHAHSRNSNAAGGTSPRTLQ